MKKLILTLLTCLSLVGLPSISHADNQTEKLVGQVTGIDSNNRILYIDQAPYYVAGNIKVTSSSGSTYYDALLVKPGTVIRFEVQRQGQQYTVTRMHVLEGLKSVPK